MTSVSSLILPADLQLVFLTETLNRCSVSNKQLNRIKRAFQDMFKGTLIKLETDAINKTVSIVGLLVSA